MFDPLLSTSTNHVVPTSAEANGSQPGDDTLRLSFGWVAVAIGGFSTALSAALNHVPVVPAILIALGVLNVLFADE